MGFSRLIGAIAAIASSITILGVNVVLLDDYANFGDMPQAVQMAPITTPALENVSAPAEMAQTHYPQYQQVAPTGRQASAASIQSVN